MAWKPKHNSGASFGTNTTEVLSLMPWYKERLFCFPRKPFLALCHEKMPTGDEEYTHRYFYSVTLCCLRPIGSIIPDQKTTANYYMGKSVEIQLYNNILAAKINVISSILGYS